MGNIIVSPVQNRSNLLAFMFIFIISIASANKGEESVLLKGAEYIVAKAIYDPGNFDKKSYSSDSYSLVSASIHFIGRLGLKNNIGKLEEIYFKLGKDSFWGALSLEICDALARLGEKEYLYKEIAYCRSVAGIKQIEAAYAIIDQNPKEALPIIRKYVYGGELNEVVSAVEILAQLQDPLAYEYLSNGLKQDEEDIRFQCAMALSRGKWNDGSKLLEYFFKHGNPGQRIRAASGLSRLGYLDAYKYVLSILNTGETKYHLYATVILGSVISEIAKVPLEKYVKDIKNPIDARISALRALGNIGKKESIDLLVKQLSSSDKLISTAAAGAIIQILNGIKLEMASPILFIAW